MLRKITKKLHIKKEALVSIFIALIMVFSAFGVIFYGYTNPTDNLKYGNFKFTQTQSGGYATDIDGKNYVFTDYPGYVDKINISGEAISGLIGKKMVYLTYDPNQTGVEEIATVQYQLQNELNSIGVFSRNAFTKPNDYHLPIITCANATQYVPVIEFRESNETRLDYGNQCYVLHAAYSEDFVRLKDRLLFGIMGIIK